MSHPPTRLRATAGVFAPPVRNTPPRLRTTPPRLRATAPVFEPTSNPATPRPHSARIPEPDTDEDDLPTPRLPANKLPCETDKQDQQPPPYIRLTDLCCQSVSPDPEDERNDEDYETFLARCERNILMYPTLDVLRAHIRSEPPTLSRLRDWFPNIDQAIRYIAGWEADGLPNYPVALRSLQQITVQGRTIKQRFPGSMLTSPSRALCGRANALSAYVFYMYACGAATDLRMPEGEGEQLTGPPSAEWQFFLGAVAHAADAARQKMLSPSVLAVGYAFRDLADQLGCFIGSGEFFTPLMFALRQNHGCEISRCNNIPQTLLIDHNTQDQLREWIVDMTCRNKDRPDPYWDGKGRIPLPSTEQGVVND